jgi:hypothetical protein
MSKLRKLERSVVKANAKKDNVSFENAWNDYRESKYVKKDSDDKVIEDKTPRNTQKKKHSFFDNKESYFKMFAWAKNLKNKNNKEE